MANDPFDQFILNIPFPHKAYFSVAELADLFDQKIAKSLAVGKDGTRVGKFRGQLVEEVELIERKVQNRTYNFTNYREKLLNRGHDRSPRQISIPTIRDRLTLRTLCQILHDKIPSSKGFLPHSIVLDVVEVIRRNPTGYSFVRIDVKNFFPSILHARLEKELVKAIEEKMFIELLMKAIRNPTGDSNTEVDRGIPQGLSISNALSAIYMRSFDSRQKGKAGHFFRYVDDILVVCPTELASDKLNSLTRSLSRMGLIAHKLGVVGKTEITEVGQGIDFLGYRIALDKVSIRESSYQRMFKNTLRVLTDYKYRKNLDKTIFRINLKITGCLVDGQRRGWMMFFAQTEDLSQLAYLDLFIVKQLKRVNLPEIERSNIKTFVKSYHEIRFNLKDTNYIPNFDTYSIDQKIDVISRLTGKSEKEVRNSSEDIIDDEFSRLISREVSDLEKDVGNPS